MYNTRIKSRAEWSDCRSLRLPAVEDVVRNVRAAATTFSGFALRLGMAIMWLKTFSFRLPPARLKRHARHASSNADSWKRCDEGHNARRNLRGRSSFWEPVATKMNQTAGGSCQHTALAAGRSAYRRQSITTSHAARLKACPDTNPCRQTEKAATQVETLSGRLSPLPKSRAKPRNRLRAPLEQRCGLGWATCF